MSSDPDGPGVPDTPENRRKLLEQAASEHIAKDKLMYEQTGNPLYLFSAWSMSRRGPAGAKFGTVPDWVLAAVDRAAEHLASMEETVIVDGTLPAHWTKVIAEAFGFASADAKGGAGRDPFGRLLDEHEWRLLATRVRVLLADGHQLTYARQFVSQTCGVSEMVVRRAWDQFGAALEAGDVEQHRRDVADDDFARKEADALFPETE
jgi:hypothetical protein